MPKIYQYPFLRLLIPLATGILLGDFFHSSTIAGEAFLIVFLLFILYFIHHRYLYKHYSLRWLSGMLAFSFLFITGYFLIYTATPIPIEKERELTALGEIKEIEERPSGWHQVTFIPYFSEDSIELQPKEKWLLVVKDEVCQNFNTQDQVVIKGKLRPHKQVTNPNSFDYGRYLSRNGFSAQMFISDSSSIHLMKRNATFRWSRIPQTIREKCESVFISRGVDSTSMGVVKAILLGDRSDIDKEVNQQFVKSGVVHILAVSGLHVGILFLIINKLLSLFLKPKSHAKWIIAVSLLLGYAFITGFSPSVSRAVLMFSIIQIGQSINKEINMYQLISLSAFILLLIQPQYIFHMGFWLSHLAVVGIIAFYPIIYGWTNFKFPIWRWGWSIVSVSTAAQLSTFPLSLYTFGAFPLLFLLSNILILPVVAPILIIALLILLFSPLIFISSMLSGLLNDLIHYMIHLTEWINSIPNSYIEMVWVSLALMIAFYFVLYHLHQIYQTASARNFINLGVWMSIGLVVVNFQLFYKISQSGIVVYDTNKGILIDLFYKGNVVTIQSENFSPTTKSYARDGFVKKSQLKSESIVVIPENEPSIKKLKIGNQIYYVVNGFPSHALPLLNTSRADGIVLRNTKFDIELLLKSVNCPLIIATSETPNWLVKKWELAASKSNTTLHSIDNKGAKATLRSLKISDAEPSQ